MNETLKTYWDVIWIERDWSWTVIGIAYTILWLIVRGLFLGELIRKAKELEKRFYREIRGEYLKRSILGWLLFLVPLVILILFWQQGRVFLPSTPEDTLLILIAALSFILSILLHVRAFGLAAIVAMKQVLERETSRSL